MKMPHGDPGVIEALCRGYLQMKRDFIDADCSNPLFKKADMGGLLVKRNRRVMKYIMDMFLSADILSNQLYCTDPSGCPLENLRPIEGQLAFLEESSLEARRLQLKLMRRNTMYSMWRSIGNMSKATVLNY